MTAIPRILLVSPVAPSRATVGRLFLRELCSYYPPGLISCVHFAPVEESERLSVLSGLPLVQVPSPWEYGFRGRWQKLPFRARFLREMWLEKTAVPRMGEAIARIAQRLRPDLLWAVLEGPTSIRLAAWATKNLRMPIITTIWDPPGYIHSAFGYGFDRLSARRLLEAFERVLGAARRNGVASETMKERYEEASGRPAVVLIHGFEIPAWEPAPETTGRTDEIVIVVAGSVRPQQEWNAFVGMLASTGWRIQGRPVLLRMLSSRMPKTAALPVRIEFLGWREPEEAARIVARADVAYLPLWLDPDYTEVVQLAFPNKLSLYVAAGTPVLFHGPELSSPSRLLTRFPVGVCCHSNEPMALRTALETLVGERDIKSRLRPVFEAAFAEELSATVFRQRFAELVGASPSCLVGGARTTARQQATARAAATA